MSVVLLLACILEVAMFVLAFACCRDRVIAFHAFKPGNTRQPGADRRDVVYEFVRASTKQHLIVCGLFAAVLVLMTATGDFSLILAGIAIVPFTVVTMSASILDDRISRDTNELNDLMDAARKELSARKELRLVELVEQRNSAPAFGPFSNN